nr:MAG TPA: hypothetical protein [Caudoviricetes sp.]
MGRPVRGCGEPLGRVAGNSAGSSSQEWSMTR